MFFIQIVIIWQKKKKKKKNKKKKKKKKKDEEIGGRGFYISFFYSLNKSIVLRLTEHCWDVNRGQTNCRYCYYSDLTRLRGKWSDLFCVLSLWRYVARSQPFALQISNWLFLAWTLIRRQKPLVFYHKGNSKTVNVSWKQTTHVPELKAFNLAEKERSTTVGCNSITFLKNYSV